MLKYRIFIPVTTQVEGLKKIYSQCPDKELITIINNYTDSEVEIFCQQAEKEGTEILRFPDNPGAAAAFNIGIAGPNRKWDSPMRGDLDYVIHLSPSCIFTNNVLDFVNVVEDEEKRHEGYYYWAPSEIYKTDQQCFAYMRRLVENIGLYDENFVPYSYEDADLTVRTGLANSLKTMVKVARSSHSLGQSLKDPRIFNYYQGNCQRIHDYYIRKWGGEIGYEQYKTPFNLGGSIKEWHPPTDMFKLSDVQI